MDLSGNKPRALLLALAAAALLTACGKQGVELGQGGSIVTGSGGPAGADKAAKELQTCDAPVAVVSLVENQRGDVGIGRGGLRQDDSVKKGRGIVAQYSVQPSLTFSEQDAGRQIGGILAAIPGLDKLAGAAEQVKLKEAQVVLLLTNNETTEQLSSATGAARTSDLDVGGLVLGKGGGLGGLGWSNTNEGKVIAAAFLGAHNQLAGAQARRQAAAGAGAHQAEWLMVAPALCGYTAGRQRQGAGAGSPTLST